MTSRWSSAPGAGCDQSGLEIIMSWTIVRNAVSFLSPVHWIRYRRLHQQWEMEEARRQRQRRLDGLLMRAAERGRVAGVRRALRLGADPNGGPQRGPFCPLMWASWAGRTAMVRDLIAAGADIDKVDRRGGTPLMWAITHERWETARVLAEHGAALDGCVDGTDVSFQQSLRRNVTASNTQDAQYCRAILDFLEAEQSRRDRIQLQSVVTEQPAVANDVVPSPRRRM